MTATPHYQAPGHPNHNLKFARGKHKPHKARERARKGKNETHTVREIVSRTLDGDDDPAGARAHGRGHRAEGVLGEARDGRELDVAMVCDGGRRADFRRAARVQDQARALRALGVSAVWGGRNG